MEQNALDYKPFEPEIYCLRCQRMEWDENKRRCANFNQARCPLRIKDILAGFPLQCLVV
jgi:hypothetical protein